MKELTESTESDIQYGELTYLHVMQHDQLKVIKRNYPERYCTCGKQILVKRSLCYKTRRYVFPSVNRFLSFKTCGDQKCIHLANYTRIQKMKVVQAEQQAKVINRTSVTGRPVDPKVKRVTLYRSSCNY